MIGWSRAPSTRVTRPSSTRATHAQVSWQSSGQQPFTTTSYALVSSNLELHVDAPPALTPDAIIGDTKLTVSSRDSGDVFIGIAPTAAVNAYLADVRHATLTGFENGGPVLDVQSGQAPALPPTRTDIWAAHSNGPATQSILWKPRNGEWTVVVMNADGTAGVAVDARVGAEVPALSWAIATLLILAATSFLAGVVLIAVPMRAVSRQNAQPW